VDRLLYESDPLEDKELPEPGDPAQPQVDALNGDDQAGTRADSTASTTTEQAVPDQPAKRSSALRIGSDVEIARCIKDELKRDHAAVPYCEGEFWRYTGAQWEPIEREKLRRLVHAYDGVPFGDRGYVRLGKNRIDSILNELGAMLSEPAFFQARSAGINCLSGFIAFDGGKPHLLPHAPQHRQRYIVRAQWQPGAAEIPEGSLLSRLLSGSFEGDDDAGEKIDLIAEIAGAAALGHGPRHTHPKAVVLLGRTAENGKSQILDLLRGLLPSNAVSSVPPSRFGDDRHIVKLVGKLLNTSDELGTAEAIASDRFKAIITGEPLTGRDVYRPAIDFRPLAQHVFACNQLPGFQGGMDRGVLRRLMPVVFNRTIPEEERIPNIGQRVVAEELDQVLAWAVEGAARLLARGHFPELASSRGALQEWAQGADPVLGWLEDRITAVGFSVVGEGPPRVTSRRAHDDFKLWAVSEGYSANALPNVNAFVQRVRAAGPSKGITYKHSGKFRGFEGMRLIPWGQEASTERVDAA
jgi:P4 family phage/plasmid primase-like protien